MIILKEIKLNNFFSKIKENLTSFELCQPANFLPIEKTYNLHKFNSNYIFKVKNNSPLTYLICRVSNKDKVILNTIVNEFDGAVEAIKYKDVNDNKATIFTVLGILFVMAINLDLSLAIAMYITTFKNFAQNDKVNLLNFISILAAAIGLLNLSILGIRFKFINFEPIIPNPPNIGYFTHNYYILGLLAIVVLIITKLIINKVYSINHTPTNHDYKKINELKI
jgi:hypothetical protein